MKIFFSWIKVLEKWFASQFIRIFWVQQFRSCLFKCESCRCRCWYIQRIKTIIDGAMQNIYPIRFVSFSQLKDSRSWISKKTLCNSLSAKIIFMKMSIQRFWTIILWIYAVRSINMENEKCTQFWHETIFAMEKSP